MITTKKILTKLRKHVTKNTDYRPTNYRLAKLLETTPTQLDNCEKKGAIMTDQMLKNAALILGYNPACFIYYGAIERGLLSDSCAKEWREILKIIELDKDWIKRGFVNKGQAS